MKRRCRKQKHDTRELKLQIEFEIKVNEINEANRYMPYAQTKSTNMTTFQRPPELGWKEDEAPLSALSARVSCDLRCWFIFEPAPRETNMVKTPRGKTCKDLERIESGSF